MLFCRPHTWAQFASIGIQVAARAGIRILSKTLTDRILRKANNEYFAPRGLRVRICRTAAMRQIVGLDEPLDSTLNKSTKARARRVKNGAHRLTEDVALGIPGIRRVYNRRSEKNIPVVDSTDVGGAIARRLVPLEGCALPLSFDVPPPAPMSGLMDKTTGLSIRLQAWAARQKESKADRKRQLLSIQEGQSMFLTPRPSAVSSRPSSSNSVMQAWERRKDRKEAEAERDAVERGQNGLVDQRLREHVQIADRKEFNAMDRLLWVVVMNSEQGNCPIIQLISVTLTILVYRCIYRRKRAC